MSIFSNIFGRNNHASNNGTEPVDAYKFPGEPELKSFENIFVNPEPPAMEEENQPAVKSALETFLSNDYYRMGYDEGYKTHSAEAKTARIHVIKSEFRLIMSRKIDHLRQEMLVLENHLIDVEGIDERLEGKIRKRLAYMQSRIDEYEAEKALSVEDEGLVMESIHKFSDGFIRGTQMYMEEKLLASSTGMFD